MQSFKVKNDYVEHIKEGEYLPGLLNFMFDFLGHVQGKPVDVSKLDITTYTPDLEPPRRDAQWLLTHLYFLCLRHVPSLTKSWFIACKSRPIVVSLESWTEKYVSYFNLIPDVLGNANDLNRSPLPLSPPPSNPSSHGPTPKPTSTPIPPLRSKSHPAPARLPPLTPSTTKSCPCE